MSTLEDAEKKSDGGFIGAQTQLNHIQLPQGSPSLNPLIPQRSHINRLILSMHNQLSNATANGWRLLQAMARKTVGKQEVYDERMTANDRVLIQRVIGVMPTTGINTFNRFKQRRTVG